MQSLLYEYSATTEAFAAGLLQLKCIDPVHLKKSLNPVWIRSLNSYFLSLFISLEQSIVQRTIHW